MRRIPFAIVTALACSLAPAHAGIVFISSPTAAYTAATQLLSITDPDGANVTSLSSGAFTANFNVPMTAATVPDTFFIWSDPPDSETSTPRVLVNPINDLTISFSNPISIFGFEAEPVPFALQDITVQFLSGATLLGSETLTLDGFGGARLFGAAAIPGDFDTVTVSSDDTFAIANLRYGNVNLDRGGFPTPEPSTLLLFGAIAVLWTISRLRMQRVARAAAAAVFACFAAGMAQANQPTPPEVDMSSVLFLNGHSLLHLVNNERTVINLVFSQGDKGTIPVTSKRVTLQPGQAMDLDLGQLVFPQGLQLFHVSSKFFDSSNLPAGPGPILFEPLMVDTGGIRKMTFEEAYLNTSMYKPVRYAVDGRNTTDNTDIGGFTDQSPIAPFAFDSTPMDLTGQLNQVTYPSPFVLSRGVLGDAGLNGDGSLGTTLGQIGVNGQARPRAGAQAQIVDDAQPNQTILHNSSTPVIKGKFFLKLGPGNYQAAWAWRARVWQDFGSFWRFVGSVYVAGDGTWSVPLDFLAANGGLPLRVEYRPANRFVQLQDPVGNVYTWADDWAVQDPNGVTDIGFRSANLTASGMPGIDTLYVAATQLWNRFDAAGINALRDTPIQVFYPNSLASGKCQQNDSNGNPYAWSCSYWADGKIYIIPKHAVNSVIQHEIGHSINSYYWNGNQPSGAGGQHNFTSCYNNGLALTEGFADFVAYWVQLKRNQVSPTVPYNNINLEAPPSNTCKAQTNETRVAATFWDMYDTINDGSASKADTWYWSKEGDSVRLFLLNQGGAMSDYLLPAFNWLQPTLWTAAGNLFRLNYIIP